MARILVSAIAILLASLLVGVTAEADSPRKQAGTTGTHEVTVEAQLIIDAQRNPKAPEDTCNTIIFYEWPDVPGTISATVTYLYKGAPYTVSGSSPFHDYLPDESPPRFAPPGRHWLSVSYGSAAGPGAGGRCEANVPTHQANYAPTGSALLTVEGPAEPPIDAKKCKKARAELRERNKAVGKLLGKLRRADSNDAKDRIREKLAKAKDKRADAVRKVDKVCT